MGSVNLVQSLAALEFCALAYNVQLEVQPATLGLSTHPQG